jgi:bifunctional non-homologous end joining protein LigD
VHWIKPQLVAEVEFTEWTRDGLLRHPSFQGLREDKKASQVVRERKTASPAEAETKPKLTNPDKVLYPEVGVTKRDLASYYESIAERIVPHLQDRPIMMKRCPNGAGKSCFYQKHLRDTAPDALRQIEIQEKNEKDFYTIVDDLDGLLWLVQMGVLEIHVWGSRAQSLERPDRLIFDIDPDVGLPWPRVIEGAKIVRDRLHAVGLESYLKTTGGKGLHVTVPVLPELEWEDAKTFCHLIAQSIADEQPDRFTTVMSKKSRQGRIFIDYLRNARGATAIAPYSTRAHPRATVATPLHWEELSARMHPDQWTVKNLARRLRDDRDDPWGDLESKRQSILGALKSIGAESHQVPPKKKGSRRSSS